MVKTFENIRAIGNHSISLWGACHSEWPVLSCTVRSSYRQSAVDVLLYRFISRKNHSGWSSWNNARI